MAGFLTQAYEYKQFSDYGTDLTKTVAMADAEAVIASAEDFVRWVEAILA